MNCNCSNRQRHHSCDPPVCCAQSLELKALSRSFQLRRVKLIVNNVPATAAATTILLFLFTLPARSSEPVRGWGAGGGMPRPAFALAQRKVLKTNAGRVLLRGERNDIWPAQQLVNQLINYTVALRTSGPSPTRPPTCFTVTASAPSLSSQLRLCVSVHLKRIYICIYFCCVFAIFYCVLYFLYVLFCFYSVVCFIQLAIQYYLHMYICMYEYACSCVPVLISL